MSGITLLAKYSTYEEENLGFQDTITAAAGGGQANAYPLTKKFNIVTVVASVNDSVKLPVAKIGLSVYVYNTAANGAAIYPQLGEYINGWVNGLNTQGGLSNIESVVQQTNLIEFVCIKDGYWITNYGNSEIVLSAPIQISDGQILTAHTSPITIVPAVSPRYCELIGGMFQTVGTGYNGNGNQNANIIVNGATNPQYQFSINGAVTGWRKIVPLSLADQTLQGEQLLFQVPGGNPAHGSGAGMTITMNLLYRLFL